MKKKYFFTLGHSVVNVATKLFFSFDHDMVKVVEDVDVVEK